MEELIQVAVPKDRLTEVYALLGSPKASEQAPPAVTNGTMEWTESTLSQLLKEASDTIRAEAKYLAGRPEQEVTSSEIANELKLAKGWNSLAGANGAWGRKLKNRGYTFPWKGYYSGDGYARFWMSAEMAALVNKVL